MADGSCEQGFVDSLAIAVLNVQDVDSRLTPLSFTLLGKMAIHPRPIFRDFPSRIAHARADHHKLPWADINLIEEKHLLWGARVRGFTQQQVTT